MDNPGVGLGAVRDELAAPHGLPSVRGLHPSTSLWECLVVQHSKIGRSMSAGGQKENPPFSALCQPWPAADITLECAPEAGPLALLLFDGRRSGRRRHCHQPK